MATKKLPKPLKGVELQLQRPIAFIDLETTGVDTIKDRIVEISVLILYPDGREEIKTRRINPGFKIPAEATAIHKITNEDVKDKPLFKQIAGGLHELIQDCDICGFNSNKFDLPMLYNEFARCEIIWSYRSVNLIDVCGIFKVKEERTLAAAYRFYLGRELEDAHSAEGDIKATLQILLAQMSRYDDLPRDMKALALFSNYNRPIVDITGAFTMDAEGDVIFVFGKHKGEKAKFNRSYLDWMLKSPTFNEDTKAIARVIWMGKTVVL